MISRPTRPTTRTEAATIARRLVASMPSSRFEMETLTRLAEIVVSHDLPTAAVECRQHPRLLINPDFVKKHCQRDEHLFLLVMHELRHVLLAHTRMQRRMTPAHNIAFDAIINAQLMSEFCRPEYMGFFDGIYEADQFPQCLLRPPDGWPGSPVYPTDNCPPGTEEIVRRLYPPFNMRRKAMPLYEEVLQLLVRSGMKLFDSVLLIGNHSETDPVHDPVMKEIMSQITERWSHIPGLGWGNALNARSRRFHFSESNEDMRRAFARVLQRTISQRRRSVPIKRPTSVTTQGGNGVLPNAHDRLAPAPTCPWSAAHAVAAKDLNTGPHSRKPKARLYLSRCLRFHELHPGLLAASGATIRRARRSGDIPVFNRGQTAALP